MEKLIPLKLIYGCLTTASVGDDPELLDMMARSGCLHVNIGMETISPESLKAINKKQNKIQDYERQFKALRHRGIGFSVNVMFGLDGDHLDIFDTTADFLIRAKVPVAFMFILAPRPATKVRDELLKEGRIFDHDWGNYCGFKAVYQPRHMTPGNWKRAIGGPTENSTPYCPFSNGKPRTSTPGTCCPLIFILPGASGVASNRRIIISSFLSFILPSFLPWGRGSG